MQSMTRAARMRRYLSLHERQRRARAEAFSRRTNTGPSAPAPVKLEPDDLVLIDSLVRHDEVIRSGGDQRVVVRIRGDTERQALTECQRRGS